LKNAKNRTIPGKVARILEILAIKTVIRGKERSWQELFFSGTMFHRNHRPSSPEENKTDSSYIRKITSDIVGNVLEIKTTSP